ncbi:MAG TPA: T9SS type A sorting domain-containing protein [Bacteroidia bacterium]|nr:T9SS type A sorting domain-containing protein [Bacteroidia bacterium]
MIKKIFLGLSLLMGLFTNAQITITSADMPNANDSLYVSTASSLGTHNPAETGANFNWDYSDVVPAYQQGVKYLAPGKFPSVYNFLFNQLNTSYGRNNPLITSFAIPGVKIEAAIDFFKESTTSLNQIGVGYVVNTIPLPFAYKHADVIYKFPMNYLNTDSCNFDFGLAIPGYGYYGQSGHRHNLVDGWGKLKTPYTTYDSTLRILSTINVTDTIYNESDSTGTKMVRPPHYEYKWFTRGSKIPVLQIDAMIISGQMVYSLIYPDSMRKDVIHLGIDEEEMVNNVKLYPNPAQDQLNIAYALNAKTPVKIVLTDILGKEIAVIVNEQQTAGTYQQMVNTSALPAGIYFITIRYGAQSHVEKLSVTH